MSKSNNPIKSDVRSIQESNSHDAVIKKIAWKLLLEAVDKMTKTNNQDVVTKENDWKLIREALDRMAKTYSQITNYIHWKHGSDNQDSKIKDVA